MEDVVRFARLKDDLATRQTLARHGDPIPDELTQQISTDIIVLERHCGIDLPQLLRGDDQERADRIGIALASRDEEAA